MIAVGVVKEIKTMENRVGLIPPFVASLVRQGHEVFVETCAGQGAGFSDEDYMKAGATITDTASEVWKRADLIVKVKEPLLQEYDNIRPNQVLFTYFHLAPNPELTNAMKNTNAVCIAYETVTDDLGRLPLLAPMSAIAGRMSVIIAANLLQKQLGGRGILASGVPGVAPAKVLILGCGNVGINAAFIANGIGADVTMVDISTDALRKADITFHGHVKTEYSNEMNISNLLCNAEIVVGATLLTGQLAQNIITRGMLKNMKNGSVIVDVAIDQGGCCETSHPTTHEDPYYEVDGIIHYCVSNMPGAYARTSTIALNNATFPYVEKLANMGYKKALSSDTNLLNGLNVYNGNITHQAVASSLNMPFINPKTLF